MQPHPPPPPPTLPPHPRTHVCLQSWKWGHDPTADTRSTTGYVGLLNPGCVCYCNSVLQQLFMVPDFRVAVLQSHRNPTREGAAEDDNTVLLARLQMVFGFLQNSRRKAHAPTEFLRAFKVCDGVCVSCGWMWHRVGVCAEGCMRPSAVPTGSSPWGHM